MEYSCSPRDCNSPDSESEDFIVIVQKNVVLL